MRCPNHQEAGGQTMTTETIPNKRFANSKWAERKQDFLIVSSFGLWAVLLAFSPQPDLRFLAGGWRRRTPLSNQNKKRGGVMDTQDNPNPNSGGFCIQAILWAVGI